MAEIKSFLSEGYDFIEEGLDVNSEPLSFTEINEEIIVESAGRAPSSYKILGRASGVFQSVGGFSRNNRRYLPEHWKIQLEKPMIQERLAQRDFLGTIGHYDHPVLDSEIAQGLVSHLVSKLEIREDANGKPFLYGELEILDTPAGRILKAMYEGGANIYVSSRAAGKLRPVPGETFQEVDPLNYHFEGFDVIRRPGFLVAKPVYEEVPVQAPDKEAVHESAEPEQPKACESAEIQTLQSQVDKLAKILEKVVDDVYEEPAHTGDVYEEVQEQPIAKPQPDKVDVKKEEKGKEKQVSEAISDFISLMASTNISEEKFEEIIDIIAAAKKENK